MDRIIASSALSEQLGNYIEEIQKEEGAIFIEDEEGKPLVAIFSDEFTRFLVGLAAMCADDIPEMIVQEITEHVCDFIRQDDELCPKIAVKNLRALADKLEALEAHDAHQRDKTPEDLPELDEIDWTADKPPEKK